MKFGSGTSAQEWAAYGPVPERVVALEHGVQALPSALSTQHTFCTRPDIVLSHSVSWCFYGFLEVSAIKIY